MSKSTVTGGAAVARRLRQITPGLTVPLNQASRKAMRPMLRAAKANAPKDDGDLKKSLIVKNRKGTTIVGPSSKYVGKDGAKPVRYAHLTEFGRADGSMAGTRWLTRAFETTKDLVIETFGREIGPAIEKRAAYLAKKAGGK